MFSLYFLKDEFENGQSNKIGKMTCHDLFNKQQHLRGLPLIIDIRAKAEFDVLHVHRSVNLPVAADSLATKPDLSTLFHGTTDDDYTVLEERCTGTDLVLYGADDATQAVCAEYLAQRFRHESPRYRIYVLKGGFTEYCKHYAFYCDAMSVVQTHSVDPTTYISYPNAIVPDLLYLGGLQEAMCLENMQDLKITHVVNMLSDGAALNAFPDSIKYLNCPLEDHEAEDIARFFEQAVEFMRSAKESKSAILVHCRQGISRSTTIVLAFLMREFNMTLKDAFDLTSHARPRILPNYGFWCQLAKLEYDLYKKSTLKRTIDMKALFPYRQEIVVGKPLCGC